MKKGGDNLTDINKGLSENEVRERIADGRVNGNPHPRTKSVKQIFAHNIFTFFNLINVVLAVLVFMVGSPKNAMFALVIVCNTAIGIFQEIRAKRVIDRLTLISAPKAHVIRDGQEVQLATEEIVMDEVVIFRTGVQAAADCQVVFGECEVNESLITGENDPVYKQIGDKILSGSFVVSGEARGVAVAIGEESFSGKITKDAKYMKKPRSEMMSAINKILKGISICIVPIMGVLFYNSIFVSGQSLERAVTSTVAAVIGMIPEGLVLLSSVVMAVSAMRLAKNNTLVQDLYCMETLARVDVLCLDKTGTITEGVMAVEEVMTLTDKPVDEAVTALMNVLNDSNPTYNALKEHWNGESGWTAEKVLPFSSARKWSGAQFKGKGSYIIGAGEFILGAEFEKIRERAEQFGSDGRRIILVAHSEMPFDGRNLPENIVSLALVAIADKIRAEAPATLRYFAEQNVEIKIISGDNPITVSTVAQKAGVKNADKYIDVSGVENISEIINAYTVFGRVTPDKKLEIVKALKAAGHTVGMTGDGVNDVPALKEADCSIAMQSGSEAARNVSNLVLLDSNFGSIPKVVAEGRRSVNNIERSASLFLSKTVYSFLLALIFLFIQRPYLFEPIQMTLINALCIGVPSFFLALQPNNSLIRGSFIGNVLRKAIPNGLTVISAMVAVMVCAGAFAYNTAQLSTLATVILAGISFMFTARCCHPVRSWKIAMLAVLIAGFTVGSLLFPKFFVLIPFSADMIICTAAITGASLVMLAGYSVIANNMADKLRRRKEDRQNG